MFKRLKEVDTRVYNRLKDVIEDTFWFIILIALFIIDKDE